MSEAENRTISAEEWRTMKALRDCTTIRAGAIGSIFATLALRGFAQATPAAAGKRDFRLAERGTAFLTAWGAL